MRSRPAAAASRALAVLAALALAAGALLTYVDRTVFRSDAFADRAAATLDRPEVRAATARRVTDVIVGVKPNLVAVRPIVELGAERVVGTAPFRSLVRRAAHDVHRAAFEDDRSGVSFEIRDTGILVAAALRSLSPDAAKRVPTNAVTRIARVKGGIDGFMLRLAERADATRRGGLIAFAAAALLAAAAGLAAASPRAWALRLGAAVAVVGALVALAASGAPGLAAGGVDAADRPAVRAVASVWLDPIAAWALAASAVGAVVALAAAAVVRPVPVTAIARRTRALVVDPPGGRLGRTVRAVVAIAVGAAMVASPRTALTAAIVVAGAAVALAATAELLALAAGPGDVGPRRVPSASTALRAGAVVLAVAVAAGVAAAASDGTGSPAPRIGRCNGHAALCDRRVDEVAFLGTHNSMSAAGEPGWLFAAQDTGIRRQLDDGVRALLIDTHYGTPTRRGVVTDLSGEHKARAALVAEVGEQFVATAERLRRRIGQAPQGPREVFLCHTLCEVGATRAVDALRAVHRFLVQHPEEVLLLSIQDETSTADTASVIRASGLGDEVYLGRAGRPWPTLRELIDRDERVIVLAENDAGGAPWMHPQPAVMQETPFLFRTAAALEAPGSCDPNRGATKGSLLLVNHWVDTSPAPRVTIARQVNAQGFLDRRLDRCRKQRRLLPNIVAVDFYRQGAAARAVDALNGLR